MIRLPLIALLAVSCSLPAEDAPSAQKLPADAAHLVEAFESDAVKIRAAAEQQIQRKVSDLVKKLEACKAAAMRRQDLDGAEAVKQTIDKYQKAHESPVSFDPLGTYVINSTAWNGSWTLERDNVCSAADGGGVCNTGTWKLDGTKVLITWKNGISESIDISDPQKLRCKMNDGETSIATKSSTR